MKGASVNKKVFMWACVLATLVYLGYYFVSAFFIMHENSQIARKNQKPASKALNYDAIMASQGQKQFEQYCIFCHDFDSTLIGPSLRHVTQRRSRDWIIKMVTSPELMLKKDPEAKMLLKKYKIDMPDLGLSKTQAEEIFEYLKKKSLSSAHDEDLERKSKEPTTASIYKGRSLFNTQCANCHNLDKPSIGPALRNVTNQRPFEWILRMILDPDFMIKNDQTAGILYQKYGIKMVNPEISTSDAKEIIKYLQHIAPKE
ncbi:MAG: cytochrome c2 [Candidatus Marinamargulisbacteria bacterium]|jgi:cytochrome c2